MMPGHEKSDLVIVAMKPANKAKKAPCGGVCGGGRSGYWTQSQGRVSKALERIRRLVPLPTRGRSRMRESRTYGRDVRFIARPPPRCAAEQRYELAPL